MDNLVIIFGISAILAAIFKKLKMPLIVGFLVAGLLIGSASLSHSDTNFIEHYAEYGAAFLMLVIGLEINFKHFKRIGWTVVWMGLMQVTLFFLITFGITVLLNYSILTAIVIAAVLTFSSTILVASVLRDKRELSSLQGRVLLGVLLLQDLLVAILLFVMPFLVEDSLGSSEMISKVSFVIASVFLLILIGRILFEYIKKVYKNEHSIIFLLTIAWLLMWIEIFQFELFDVPPEIIGLAVGLSLSGVFEVDRVANWFDPIKDYFVVFLFFYVGMNVKTEWLIADWFFLLNLFVGLVVIKSLIGWLTAAVARMPRKVIMVVGLGLANVSELGFVILPLAFRLGILPERELSILSGLILLTLISSSIVLYNTNDLCFGFCGFFKLLERRQLVGKTNESDQMKGKKVLIGAHRSGWAMLKSYTGMKNDIVVLDYDIHVVSRLRKMGYNAILADISDQRFLYEIGLCKSKMVISTIPNVNDSIGLAHFLNNNFTGKKPYYVVVSSNKHETEVLYEEGVDMVVDKYIATANGLLDVVESRNRTRLESKMKKRQSVIYNMKLN